MRWPIVLVLLVSGCAREERASEGPSAERIERGRAIYHRGVSADGGEIEVRLGGSGSVMPASFFPCANCHGEDGRGRPEGGVMPPDITWASLTRPYPVTLPGGRRRAPYDRAKVLRAITAGIDSSGTELSVAMPRYRLGRDDAADLLAYLEQQEALPVPGVRDDVIRIGLLGAPAPIARQLEEGRPIYGRTLELVPLDPPADVEPAALAAWLERQDVLACLSVGEVAGASRVPLLPVSELPRLLRALHGLGRGVTRETLAGHLQRQAPR